MKRVLFLLVMVVVFTACENGSSDNTFIIKYFGDVKKNKGTSIASTGDGYVISGLLTDVKRKEGNYIIGYSDRIGLIRTTIEGNLVWQEFYGGKLQGEASKVIIEPDGKIVATGYITDTVELETDIFVLKTGSTGDAEIFKIFKKTGNQTGSDILKTPNGYIVLGTTDVERSGSTQYNGNTEGNTDILLTFLNNSLDETETTDGIGYVGNDLGAAIKEDPAGGYIVVGTTDYTPVGTSSNNIIIVKVNAVGNVTEPVIIGGTKDEFVADFEVLPNGYLIAGTVGKSTVKQVPFLLKLGSDINTDPLFMKELESENSRAIKSISRYRNNYFILAGKEGTTTSSKVLFFVTDAEGNQVPGWEKVTGSDGVQAANDVLSDSEGWVVAVGENTFDINSLICLIKFRF